MTSMAMSVFSCVSSEARVATTGLSMSMGYRVLGSAATWM